jgi:hypothetical protein
MIRPITCLAYCGHRGEITDIEGLIIRYSVSLYDLSDTCVRSSFAFWLLPHLMRFFQRTRQKLCYFRQSFFRMRRTTQGRCSLKAILHALYSACGMRCTVHAACAAQCMRHALHNACGMRCTMHAATLCLGALRRAIAK